MTEWIVDWGDGTTPDTVAKTNSFLIWRGGELKDFDLRLSFRIKGGNSGVQYRSKVLDPKTWRVGGYQGDFEAGKTYEHGGLSVQECVTPVITLTSGGVTTSTATIASAACSAETRVVSMRMSGSSGGS
mgnify:CR=1 FL=1